jgi:hypothetical protein
MSARAPRRSFATPFVVTVAAALPATACYVETRPAPQAPADQTARPMTNVGTTGPASTSNAGVQPDPAPPPAPPPTVVANPPRPTTAPTAPIVTSDQRWTIARTNGTCLAHVNVKCPTAPKGQPQPTCNPPRPTAYTCPPTLAEGASMVVVQRAGQRECFVEPGPMKCPKGAICNPPPPQKVACPK